MSRQDSYESLKQNRRGEVAVIARIKPAESGEQSVFSGDDERGCTVVASHIPLKSRLAVQSQYKSDADIEKIAGILPPNAEPEVFQFDAVYSHRTSQETFYRKTSRDAVTRVVQGSNAAILIHGPSRSGKTFTFVGADRQQKGLVFRCAEDLLGECTEQSLAGIGMSVFCIFDNEIFDLLADIDNKNKRQHDILESSNGDVRIIGLTVMKVRGKSEVKMHYVAALKEIQRVSAVVLGGENKLYEKSHLIVQFEFTPKTQCTSKLQLIRLADSEEKQCQQDLNVVHEVIRQINNKSEFAGRSFKKSKLTSAIRDTLNCSHRATLIACLSSASQSFKQSLFALGHMNQQVERQKNLIYSNAGTQATQP